jgi:hypothetical protein
LTATERARPLLQPDHRDAPQQDGVIDLIADDGFAPRGSAQRLMFTDVVPAIDAAVPRPELRRRVLLCHHPMFADAFRALDHISARRPFAYIWADHTGAGCGARRRAVTLRTRSESRGLGWFGRMYDEFRGRQPGFGAWRRARNGA